MRAVLRREELIRDGYAVLMSQGMRGLILHGTGGVSSLRKH